MVEGTGFGQKKNGALKKNDLTCNGQAKLSSYGAVDPADSASALHKIGVLERVETTVAYA